MRISLQNAERLVNWTNSSSLKVSVMGRDGMVHRAKGLRPFTVCSPDAARRSPITLVISYPRPQQSLMVFLKMKIKKQ